MTQFHALTPKQAIEIIEAVGVEDAAKLIRDHAAAGLVKTYAQVQVTIPPAGDRTTVRDAALSPSLWERMITEGVDSDAWSGGTVRLPGSELIGGPPAVHITGISFNPTHIERLGHQQQPKHRSRATDHRALMPTASTAARAPTRSRPVPDLTHVPFGALQLTVEQTKAALAIGHTTVYKLLKTGELQRAASSAGTRITAASVRRYAGVAEQPSSSSPAA